ncbi:MAG: pseudouridine synthase [Lachnospiraceae bacterium]|nr:pseudouridine synthase [Lachnospiraceae bacterium]
MSEKKLAQVNTDGVRLNKYLSDGGYCSRREADRLIEAGRVFIDGKVALMGQKVLEGQKVTVMNGAGDKTHKKEIKRQEKLVLIALNKPVGVECTSDRSNPDNIIDYVGYKSRVFPVGRLDKNSEGLILLTNDGQLADKMMRAANYHEKEYIVTTDKAFNNDFIKKMGAGVPLKDEEHNLDVVTRKCHVERVSDNVFKIILTQGYNRQIRRMCSYFGYNVVKLKRVRIMNIKLGSLKSGAYRELATHEIKELKSQLR